MPDHDQLPHAEKEGRNTLWKPVASIQPHTPRATKKGTIYPRSNANLQSPQHACRKDHVDSEDFVLVNTVQGQTSAVMVDLSALCANEQDAETDFVLVDNE